MADLPSELRRLAPLDHSRVLGDVMRMAADEIERLKRSGLSQLERQVGALIEQCQQLEKDREYNAELVRERDDEIERLTRELADTSAALETEKQCVARYLREHMTLRRGIRELDDIHRHERAYADLDPYDGRWYVYEHDGQCNDDRHADSLLGLVKKLGEPQQ